METFSVVLSHSLTWLWQVVCTCLLETSSAAHPSFPTTRHPPLSNSNPWEPWGQSRWWPGIQYCTWKLITLVFESVLWCYLQRVKHWDAGCSIWPLHEAGGNGGVLVWECSCGGVDQRRQTQNEWRDTHHHQCHQDCLLLQMPTQRFHNHQISKARGFKFMNF